MSLVEYKENAHPHGKRTKKNTLSSSGKKQQDSTKRVDTEGPLKEGRGGEGGGGGGGGGRNGVEKMNKMAVQRVDSGVETIVATVPQVVLYEYDENSNTWERTSIEGTLFIYQRARHHPGPHNSTSPSHGVVLLNRLSSDNLQVMIQPGSEFRVQGQFVLFKKRSDGDNVFGLCFNDAQLAISNGRLLDEFSKRCQQCNDGSVSGHAPPLSMRSQSVPSFSHHNQVVVGRYRAGGDVQQELLENAGNAYLNQNFSDDAGSSGQESPSSDPVSFSISCPQTSSSSSSSNHPSDQGQPLNGGHSAVHHHHQPQQRVSMRDGGGQQMKRSTPRTVPKLVNMSTTPPPPPPASHLPTSSSSSSSSVSHMVGVSSTQNKDQYSSRVASSHTSTTHRSVRPSDGSSRGATNTRSAAGSTGVVSRQPPQNPASSGYVKTTQRGEVTTRSGGARSSSSTGSVSGSRRKLRVPPPTSRGMDNIHEQTPSSLPTNNMTGPQSLPSSQEVATEPPLARQLFEPPVPHATPPPHPHPVPPLSSAHPTVVGATLTNPASTMASKGRNASTNSATAVVSTSNPPHLQTLFSQSLPHSLSSSLPSSLLTNNKPMSLAEVEKQMKEEALSPDKNPENLAGGSGMFILPPASYPSSFIPPYSNHPPPPPVSSNITTTLPSSLPGQIASSSTTGSCNTASSGGSEEQHVLIQPSSFSVATPPSRANTTPIYMSTTLPSRANTIPLSSATPLTTHSEPTNGGNNNAGGNMRGQSTVRRSTTDIELNIVPPSPVITDSNLPRKLLTNGVFPDVPPLMHSPGMRAPPVTQTPPISQSGQKPHEQTDSGTPRINRGGSQGETSSRRGKRNQRKTGSPLAQVGKSPSPQLDVMTGGFDVPMGVVGTPPKRGVVETPPTRSYSVPNNMNPDVSVTVPAQRAGQPHALLSPQQFSLSETSPPPPPTLSSTPPPVPPPVPVTLSSAHPPAPPAHPTDPQHLMREQLRQTLIHLIQNDEDFFNQICRTYYHVGLSKNSQ